MAEKKAMGLKRSMVLKIEAALVEIMEDAGFNVMENVVVVPAQIEGHFKMTFEKGSTSLATLNAIQEKIGSCFEISISPVARTVIAVEIEASEKDFVKLLDSADSHVREM